MNLNRRSQVLRLAERGESVKEVAAAVGVPVGEVEFILKVDRMLRTAF
jgi:DNA-binding NarL/FixJ family response regulator